MKLRCNTCGTDNPADSSTCSSCGAALSTEKITIPATSDKLNFLQSVQSDRSGLKPALTVFILCILISLVGWYPLSLPSRLIRWILPTVQCTSMEPGSPMMYLCSAGVGLIAMAAPILLILLIFFLRKPLTNWVTGIVPKLPSESQFLVAPALATIIFCIAWSGAHKDTSFKWGILPQIIFPAVLGLFTYIVMRFGPGIQHNLEAFFNSRDRFPRWLRILAVIGIPMLIAILITVQERVTFEAFKEQFVVIVALIIGYLVMSPRIRAQDKRAVQKIRGADSDTQQKT